MLKIIRFPMIHTLKKISWLSGGSSMTDVTSSLQFFAYQFPFYELLILSLSRSIYNIFTTSLFAFSLFL